MDPVPHVNIVYALSVTSDIARPVTHINIVNTHFTVISKLYNIIIRKMAFGATMALTVKNTRNTRDKDSVKKQLKRFIRIYLLNRKCITEIKNSQKCKTNVNHLTVNIVMVTTLVSHPALAYLSTERLIGQAQVSPPPHPVPNASPNVLLCDSCAIVT